MSRLALVGLVSLAFLSTGALSVGAWAQTAAPTTAGPSYPTTPPKETSQPPAASVGDSGDPLLARSDTGLDKVGKDGVSTRTVPAVGCGTVARETDGTTTCIGIPGPRGRIDARSGTTYRER